MMSTNGISCLVTFRYNHITLKLDQECADVLQVPGPLFLINPFGCRFDEVTPASLHAIVRYGHALVPPPHLPTTHFP